MVTREQAREISEQFLRARSPAAGWDGVAEVRSPEEVEASLSAALRALLPLDATVRRCWTVYVGGAAGGGLLIDRETGEVEFAGAVQGGPRAPAG